MSSRPGTHILEWTVDPEKGAGKGTMVDWYSHLGGAMGLHVTILPSLWHTAAQSPQLQEMRDVVVDVPIMLQQLEQIYIGHDYDRPQD